MLRISGHSSKELRTIIMATRRLPRELRKEIRQRTRQMARPEWERAVREHASTRLEHRILADTARVAVSDRNVMLQSAQLSRPISGGRKGGGLRPSENWASIEFGADQGRRISYRSHRTSREHGRRWFDVENRHTTHQLRRPTRQGYAVYPAAANIIPRIAALWAQTTARTIHEAFEER